MTTLVSLAALRTFVEVARLRSFKDAAQRLGVTSGAVSQQIKIVEQRLDVTLFERSSRNVRLTDQGARLLGAIRVPFEQIHEAVEDFNCCRSRRNVVRIVASTALASQWLVHRIDAFWSLHPDVEVRIDVADGSILGEDTFDIAIQYGKQAAPGIEARKLPTWGRNKISSKSYV